MPSKFIFIGAGGSGTNTVARIKYKIYERIQPTAIKSKLEILNETYKFIFIDTDNRDINAINEQYRDLFENGKVEMISADTELLDLGTENPCQIYESAKEYSDLKINKRIVESCSEDYINQFGNRALRNGAEATRLNSRIAFGKKSEEFCGMLSNNINALNQAAVGGGAQQNTMNYWVVCSSAGGTGSGCVNDILYYVDMVHKSNVNVGNPRLFLALFMPQVYIDTNAGNPKYPKNGYATMRELEGFKVLYENNQAGDKGGLLFHRLALLHDNSRIQPTFPFNPFDAVIPIDFMTDSETNMGDIMSMYSNAAELIYYVHDGGIAGKYWADRNNYYAQGKLAHCFVTAMGYVALRKPEKEFDDYVRLRTKYEVLKYGIIGEPLQSEEDLRSVTLSLFNNVIAKYLFKADDNESYFRLLKQISGDRIEESFSENVILDENSNPMRHLPDTVSEAEAETVISEIKVAFSRKKLRKEATIDAIESELFEWVEKNVRQHGLEYVKSVLSELDTYCTDLYDSYIDANSRTELLEAVKQRRRSSLVEIKDSTHANLDDLYQKAEQITLSERISGSNKDDVSAYFGCLKAWVEETANYMISEDIFSILKTVAYGDCAILDNVRNWVSNLSSAASSALLKSPGGAYSGYWGLSRSFLRKKEDVSSVYLPDITTFADACGWVSGNKFDKWYENIFTPSSKYVKGEGFVPVRMGAQKTLEGFFTEMVNTCSTELLKDGYISADEKRESRLFVNRTIDNPTKIIEDLLDFAVDTVEHIAHSSPVLPNAWYTKPLSSFFSELDLDSRKAVKKRLKPALFFSYEKNRNANQTFSKSYYSGPTYEIASDIFNFNDQKLFCSSNDLSLMYALTVTFQMSFEDCRTFKALKRDYMNSADRSLYHFHQAIANIDGHYQDVKLPKEYDNNFLTFVRYLLLDKFSTHLTSILYHSTAAFETDNFKDSPYLIDGDVVYLAKKSAVSMIGEEVALKYRSDGVDNYLAFPIENSNLFYSGLYSAFLKEFNTCGFNYFVSQYIRSIIYAEQDLLMKKFNNALNELKIELNSKWTSATKKTEKEFIGDMLTVLNTLLNTYNKFIDCNY